jgi:hypothetical protein
MLLAGIGVDAVDRGSIRAIILTVFLLLTGIGLIGRTVRDQPQYSWCAWEPMAGEVVSYDPNTVRKPIYVFEDLVGYHLWFATRNDRALHVVAAKGIEGITEDTAYFLPRGFDEVKTVGSKDAFVEDRFWAAFREPGSKPISGTAAVIERPAAIATIEGRGFKAARIQKREAGAEIAYIVEFVRDVE